MVGCLGKLKDSIHSLNVTYLQPGINRDDIFNPKTCFNGNGFLLSSGACSDGESGTSNAIYRCSNASMNCSYYSHQTCRSNATVYKGAICPDCRGSMNVKMNPILPKKEVKKKKGKVEGGYVKEVVTYMVMDDLVVKPMSTISSIILITKFGVKDLNNLEEKTVYFGKDEGLKLLKSALKSNTVLTKVFLGKVGKGNMSYKRSKCH
ncbi:hypothetical protein CTI12_AA627100 [Artemisia annua]|uniref:Uncharacterized protein n=1 Tax=Artemisia annua TaxID=35608 RepID=A0A2U1KA23_ARTAN|nr:hypothetical protein CTI12_AA627100 [Artemisia annua]